MSLGHAPGLPSAKIGAFVAGTTDGSTEGASARLGITA